MEGWRSKIRGFGFVKLRAVVGPKSRLDLGGSLWHTYFLKILLVCEEMSTGVVGKNRVIFEVCSETRIFIVDIALSTSAGQFFFVFLIFSLKIHYVQNHHFHISFLHSFLFFRNPH